MKHPRSFRSLVIMLSILSLASTAWAKPDVAISISAKKEVVVAENGKQVKKTVEAKEINPGEVVTFILSFSNKGNEPATSVVISDPIPDGTVYIPGTATELGELEFSIDGGKNYKKPSMLVYEMKKPDGTREKRIATPEQYTHLRWVIPKIEPGGKGTVSFQVRVK